MIALIDGDVIAHMACKSRFAKPAPPGMLYTDLVTIVPDKDNHEFTKEEDQKYLEESWDSFKKRLDEILELCFAEDFLMAVKSEHNFRDAMYPMEFNEQKTKAIWGYKANRWKPKGQSNHFVPILRKLAVAESLGIEATGREADDLLRMWAEQAMQAGEPYIIVSIDKDLKCIPGKHYNIKSKEITDVSVFEAQRFFYQQLLSGDTTDNIPGVPGIGPVKAEKFLYNLSTEEEMQEVVVEMYMSAYETDWHNMLLSNGKMLYLQKNEDDFFTLQDWPVVNALLGDLLSVRRKGGAHVTNGFVATKNGVSETRTLPKPPEPAKPPSPRLGAGATIAVSPIPRPSPPLAPPLAPKKPLLEPVPKTPSKSTTCVQSPQKTVPIFTGKVPSLKGA